MAFCRNCGHEVHDTDNFCLYCGTATKDKTDNSSQSEQKRKESFDGEIKKCPYCGEILKSFETNCPTCGLELRNVSVANSVKELSNKIQLIEANSALKQEITRRLFVSNARKVNMLYINKRSLRISVRSKLKSKLRLV